MRNHKGFSNRVLVQWAPAIVIAAGVFLFFAHWQAGQRDHLAGIIREQVRNELRSQVRSEILAELREEFAGVMREDMRNEFDRQMASSSAQQGEITAGVPQTAFNQRSPGFMDYLQNLWPRSRESHTNLSDDVLDQYVAGDDAAPQVSTPVGQKATTGSKKTASAVPTTGKSKSTPQKKTAAKKDQGPSKVAVKPAKEIPQAIERTMEGRGNMLLPKKALQYEPSLTYAAFSSNRLNIQGYAILPVLVFGTINTDEVNRDVFINTHTFRYGLFDNFQTELKIPFRGEYDRVVSTNNSLSTRGDAGFGDVEFGVSRQIGWEQGAMPDLLWASAIKAPTGRSPYDDTIAFGTGHWGLRNSLIAVHSSDPAVLFGNLSYTYNFARNGITDYGDIKPGDSIGYGVGTAIALSYQTAITFAFDQSFTFEMIRNDVQINDSFLNSANFKVGMNYALTEKSAIDFSLGMGLTKDSPDFTLDLRFPMRF